MALILSLWGRESYAQVTKAVHPEIGTKVYAADSSFSLTLIAKKQYFEPADTLTADSDIHSPKSVNMHPNGTKYYVNSLEGATTVVYDFLTHRKLKVIRHNFTDADTVLLGSHFTPYYKFTHYTPDDKHPVSPFGGWGAFYGKPVESTFSHGGRYLWVPYYRRSYDINAQDPSAVAIIDTGTDSIIRLMDTGPLPKMVATSPDGKLIAITHWGDNTVGIIDISSADPFEWHYTSLAIIDQQLKLNFSLTQQIDRDNNSGHCLRGTAFTPDNRYLLVGCMAGTGGIAVVDLQPAQPNNRTTAQPNNRTTAQPQYLGRITGMMPNLRHLIIRDGHLYLSINRDGYVQKMPLKQFLEAIPRFSASPNKVITITNWQTCKVGTGARTIETTPDGRFLFVACNNSSVLYVVDAQTMTVLTSIPVDSYPVGLDISHDGRYVFTTSQGRGNSGGNCVDIYELEIKQ